MAEQPSAPVDIVLAHFIVSDDVERSKRFYTEVLGGRLAFSGPGGLTYVALSNTWIIINVGGGPTDDKPSVTLETPRDPDRVSSFLNIRVRDIHAVYADWSARGRGVPDAAEAAPVRDPLLHPRSRRLPDRGRPDDRLRRRLEAAPLAVGGTRIRQWPGPSGPGHCAHVAALRLQSRRLAVAGLVAQGASTSSLPSLSSRRSAAGGSGEDAR